MKTFHNPGSRWISTMAFLATSTFAFSTAELAPTGEKEISEFIAMDVASDSRMEGTKVSVSIVKGIAVLTGEVKTIDQAERAAERAMAASGVRAVLNRLQLTAGPVADSKLASTVKAALDSNGALDAKRVKISSEGGIVTLAGQVGTWDEQELAREIASKVPGVAGIENRTEVVFDSIRTDKQIENQLRELIANDPLYDGLSLAVTVKEGLVGLRGEVGSKGEYDRLVRRSSVTGVFEVNADKLAVNSDLKMEAVEDKHLTSEQMMVALKDVLAMDDRLDPRSVSFTLAEGVVTLDGTVTRREEKSAAESTVRGVPGVLAVDNRIRVMEGRPVMAAANAPLVVPR